MRFQHFSFHSLPNMSTVFESPVFGMPFLIKSFQKLAIFGCRKLNVILNGILLKGYSFVSAFWILVSNALVYNYVLWVCAFSIT